MTKPRVAPHRPHKESAIATEKEDLRGINRSLKKENKRLRKEVAALRKQPNKTTASLDVDKDDVEPMESEVDHPPSERCPTCEGANIFVFETPAGTLVRFCRACKERIPTL